MIKEAIAKLVEGQDLSREEAVGAMSDLMSGEATPAQVGGFLVALRMKGETVQEIAGLAQVMREKAEQVHIDGDLTDTCGTGGDGLGTFNVSTAAAFVAAAAGIPVAKHGNRGQSSQCGSADVLEALGFEIMLEPDQVRRAIEQSGFGFMFAQRYHPAMKYVAPVRRELGVRTVFNFLGPLTNPAGARRQVLGVPNASVAEKMAEALRLLGSQHALVVSGESGIDEIALHGPTQVFEVRPSGVVKSVIGPEQFGIDAAPLSEVSGSDAAANAAMIRNVFAGAPGPKRDVVVLNAGAALYVGGKASNLDEGINKAIALIDSGEAGQALERAALASRGQ